MTRAYRGPWQRGAPTMASLRQLCAECPGGAPCATREETVIAPFPYAGGKAAIAAEVWTRFGNVPNYVEPFFGSGAVLLARPGGAGKTETANDADGLVSNLWRAIQADPEAVAHHADWPVHECDLHARHAWLVGQRESLSTRLEGDPAFYDARAAGWWLWGACAWIGSGWCSGDGPWKVVDGRLVKTDESGGARRKLPHVGNAGMGINRQLPHVGNAGRGDLYAYMAALSERLRRVRFACGPWDRILGESVTVRHGLTAVLLDPPYADDEHAWDYAAGGGVWEAARAWAVENGNNPLLRIALCGYDRPGLAFPDGWAAYRWKARGGYGSQGDGRGRENARRETVWFSPACLNDTPLEALLRQSEAANPTERIRGFAGAVMPFQIALLHAIYASDMHMAESLLHQQYKHCRRAGEWFQLTAHDLDELLSLQAFDEAA